MRHDLKCQLQHWIGLILCGLLLSGCARATYKDTAYLRTGNTWQDAVELVRIRPDLWMHVTYQDGETGLASGNGLVVLGDKEVLLVNLTPDTHRTRQLLSLVEASFGMRPGCVLLTDTHPACIGGLELLRKEGVDVRTSQRIADALGLEEAVRISPEGTAVPEEGGPLSFHFDGIAMQLFSPLEPAGATDDTLWIPGEEILYSRSLFHAMDVPLPAPKNPQATLDWLAILEQGLQGYGDSVLCIPGSGQWGTSELLTYTHARLVEELPKQMREKRENNRTNGANWNNENMGNEENIENP